MTMAPGHFQLYTDFQPALTAGDYRFTTTQNLAAVDKDGTLDATDLPVEALQTHVRVTSPRFLLPPDQALSTYPPAGTEGAYGSRLPQVVIKRRTLPWERQVDGAPAGAPWLALVVFAEGEAQVLTNVPAADCVTPGVTLSGDPDVAKASCLSIRQSMVHTIMPTQLDVPLLVHGREVDLGDTELMMGDDDGFLAVVIANRLPLPVHAADGSEVPVKYHAALVNLEGQWSALLPKAPPHVTFTSHLVLDAVGVTYTQAAYDQVVMGLTDAHPSAVFGGVLGPHADAAGPAPLAAPAVSGYTAKVSPETVAAAYEGTQSWVTSTQGVKGTVVSEGFAGYASGGILQAFDPTLRFPVLLTWSFTSIGDLTFEKLLKSVDSGLLGTRGTDPVAPVGRGPLEVTETGHVGLDQRTRRGDLVRAWYRGPLLPHPADLAAPRLALAHTGDQLRAVIPDGREDLSLAAAFEIGRLLALSQPSLVAALMQWRQTGYQATRDHVIWDGILAELDLGGVAVQSGPALGGLLARGLAAAIAQDPGGTVGPPRMMTTAGAPMDLPQSGLAAVVKGYGLDVSVDQGLPELLGTLRSTEVPRMPLVDLTRPAATTALTTALETTRAPLVGQLVAGALSTQIMTEPGRVAGLPGIPGIPGGILGGVPVVPHTDTPDDGPDALDEALHGGARP
ncbi:MAG TPA: hypothetical protein VIM01_10880 [Dermatophilaceae bacterium]